MNIFDLKKLDDFKAKHSDARKALEAWEQIIRRGTFKHLVDLQNTYRWVEFKKETDTYVFKKIAKKYRLTVTIDFQAQNLRIRAIEEHDEYDRKNKQRKRQ